MADVPGLSLERIVEDYQDRVFRLACAILGDAGAAEEATQDAFVRVWKALPKFRGEAAIGTWIYAIARNVCLSRRRREALRRCFSLEEPRVRAAVESQRGGPARPEAGIDIAALIAELPRRYQCVVRLYFLEDQSYQQVAEALGLPMGTVKTYLHRARKRMAARLVRTEKDGELACPATDSRI